MITILKGLKLNKFDLQVPLEILLVFAIALAALFLQETPTPALVLGGLLVLAGVITTNWRG
ncbi:MAG: hypothetical protein HC922_10315 [Leptolyngbyaceae cyanobacterium SM2_3_12]|nr:hypothetical protein [Leptolyngbyaceae cyanobacterium SM2_3_12]